MKGIVHQKNLLLFTHIHVIPNPFAVIVLVNIYIFSVYLS